MGYTHSWLRPKDLDHEKFAAAAADCRRVCEASGVTLRGIEGAADPVFADFIVAFDGGCEPFIVQCVCDERAPERPRRDKPGCHFGYCKTEHLPYDLCVQAALIILAHHLGAEFAVSSDGDSASLLMLKCDTLLVMAKLTPHGRTPNLPLNNDPVSGWRNPADWSIWQNDLPNAYVYRLRAVSSNGTPLAIPEGKHINERGLLYVGETGVKNNDPSYRLQHLARGVSDRAYNSPHDAANRYWNEDWPSKLAAIDPSFRLEVGWDPQLDECIIAATEDGILRAEASRGMISHSGKAAAQGMEAFMLRQYASEYPASPPLNRARSPGWSERDRKTRRTSDQDFESRDQGEVEMGDPNSDDVRRLIAENMATREIHNQNPDAPLSG